VVGPTLPVEDIALLFVIDMAGDKVIMASFCALISCSLMRRSLLAYLIVDFRTGTSLVELWEHLGVNKTSNGILAHLYWPNIRRDVAKNC
jgi:hypothetical protein